MLEINKLSKGFLDRGNYSKILDQLELKVGDGEVVAIVGKSGSGKSTFLSLISGIQGPDEGEIILDGKSLTSMKDDERTSFRSRFMATIFQDFKLVDHLTVLENILLPLQIAQTENMLERAQTMLKAVELDHRRDAFPETLSGGERQRVAMARALAMDSKLILADEPNANLDVETGKHVMDYLFKLTKEHNKTMILVTHDMELSKQCDKIYRLVNGKLEN